MSWLPRVPVIRDNFECDAIVMLPTPVPHIDKPVEVGQSLLADWFSAAYGLPRLAQSRRHQTEHGMVQRAQDMPMAGIVAVEALRVAQFGAFQRQREAVQPWLVLQRIPGEHGTHHI